MRVGIPREVKDHEYRVGMIPAGVHALVQAGHQVMAQTGAGAGSGITDDDYIDAIYDISAVVTPLVFETWSGVGT